MNRKNGRCARLSGNKQVSASNWYGRNVIQINTSH